MQEATSLHLFSKGYLEEYSQSTSVCQHLASLTQIYCWLSQGRSLEGSGGHREDFLKGGSPTGPWPLSWVLAAERVHAKVYSAQGAFNGADLTRVGVELTNWRTTTKKSTWSQCSLFLWSAELVLRLLQGFRNLVLLLSLVESLPNGSNSGWCFCLQHRPWFFKDLQSGIEWCDIEVAASLKLHCPTGNMGALALSIGHSLKSRRVRTNRIFTTWGVLF